MVSYIAGCGVRWFLGVWHVHAVSCAVGRGRYFFICLSAPALSVATWVCSFIKAAAFLLAWLCLCIMMLVPPGFPVMIVEMRVVLSNPNSLSFFVL